jgi:hypothetical protein
MRCALIQSSIRALSGNVSPELLEQLVRAGLWSGVRALETIRQMPDEAQRALALAQVAPYLAADLLGEALSVARAIKREYDRAKALSALAPRLSEPLLAEALAAAREIGDARWRAEALGALAPHLSEPLLAEALAAAREIKDEDDRAKALGALAPHLSAPLRSEAFVQLAQQVWWRQASFDSAMQAWQADGFAGLTFEAWQQALAAFAARPREDCLKGLLAALPLIAHRGGQAAVDELYLALCDVWR